MQLCRCRTCCNMQLAGHQGCTGCGITSKAGGWRGQGRQTSDPGHLPTAVCRWSSLVPGLPILLLAMPTELSRRRHKLPLHHKRWTKRQRFNAHQLSGVKGVLWHHTHPIHDCLQTRGARRDYNVRSTANNSPPLASRKSLRPVMRGPRGRGGPPPPPPPRPPPRLRLA